MSKERKRILVWFSLLNSSVLVFVLLFYLIFDPVGLIDKESASTCVFQNTFHLYCPACGGTRAVGYFLIGDILNSFIHYPPLFIGIGLIVYIDILYIISFRRGNLSLFKKKKYYEFLLIPISILLFFFIRNFLLLNCIDILGDIIKRT